MPQTLLALAAVFCFTYLALNRQQANQDVEMRAISAEIDLAATDVARAWMTKVERNAFDEDDTGRVGVRTKPSDFPLGPDDGEASPAEYDDVDDWTGFSVSETVPVGLGTLSFRTYVSVRYVDDKKVWERKGKATLTKEITIVVLEEHDHELGRPAGRVVLRRVVTPAGIASATPVVT